MEITTPTHSCSLGVKCPLKVFLSRVCVYLRSPAVYKPGFEAVVLVYSSRSFVVYVKYGKVKKLVEKLNTLIQKC